MVDTAKAFGDLVVVVLGVVHMVAGAWVVNDCVEAATNKNKLQHTIKELSHTTRFP